MYRYMEGYLEAKASVENQSLEEDLELIGLLFGRGRLKYGATPDEVKAEALRQLEIEWRAELVASR
jgi:hypothetical protein